MAEDRLAAEEIVGIFEALAQTTRLEAYRLLLRYLPYGLPAGDIARLLAVPHNTLSTHIAHLERAGLVLGRREGRSVIYAANSSKLGHVLTTMLADLGASLDDLTLAAPAFPQKRPKVGEQAGPQCSVSLHRQRRALHSGGGDPEPRGRRPLPRFFGRQPARRAARSDRRRIAVVARL